METLFSWTKPNEWNNLNHYKRYSKLELFTYINEFELMYGLFIEETITEYLQLPKIISIMKTITKETVKKIEEGWIYLKSNIDKYSDTS